MDWKKSLINDDFFKIDRSQETNLVRDLCHGLAVESGWWTDLKTGERKERNKGELICLMHSELSEAMEGVRKNKMDDHLPHRKSEEVELADVLIRIFDYAGAYGLDIGGAMVEKLIYNSTREDHKIENRAKD
jgi:NTP pyrophosphatase (non-canonical NTP hydrolase)